MDLNALTCLEKEGELSCPFRYAGTKDIGLSFVINDSDGSGRKGWLSYMGGIANGKDPAQFGDLILKN